MCSLVLTWPWLPCQPWTWIMSVMMEIREQKQARPWSCYMFCLLLVQTPAWRLCFLQVVVSKFIFLFLQPSRSSQNHWDLLACWRFGHCQFGHWVDLRTDTSSRSALSRRRRRQGQHHEDMEATDGTARHGAGGTLSSAASEPKRRMSKRLTGWNAVPPPVFFTFFRVFVEFWNGCQWMSLISHHVTSVFIPSRFWQTIHKSSSLGTLKHFFCGKVAPFGSRNPAPLKTNLKTIKQALGTQNHPVAADDAIPKFHWAVSWWNKAVIGSPGLKTTACQNETCASHLLSIPIDIVKTRPEKNRKNDNGGNNGTRRAQTKGKRL